MKTLHVLSAIIIMIAAIPEYIRAEPLTAVTTNEILASVHAADVYGFEAPVKKLRKERDALGRKLLTVLNDKQVSNINRCGAAYYLGELRLTNGVDGLAANISLKFDKSQVEVKMLIVIDILGHPAADALVKIGVPAVPKLIQNLADIDDPITRSLSLQVLCRIEGDKDIVQLRFQKAIANETSAVKKARLQSAINTLPGLQLEKLPGE